MDLKVNNISFNGKLEIMYGLEKASKLAQTIEFGRTAYRNPGKLEDGLIFNAAMRAYLDMATKDAGFWGTVKEINKRELQPIKDNLQELTTQHGTLKPFKVFKEALDNVIKQDRGGAKSKKEAANNLLKLLA